tara:strand:- start:286 stop:759 length:474 start_codon:yes stop_codon:yes gene_type:complete
MNIIENIVVGVLFIGLLAMYAYFSNFIRAWSSDKQIRPNRRMAFMKVLPFMVISTVLFIVDITAIYLAFYVVYDKTSIVVLSYLVPALLFVMLYLPYMYYDGPQNVISERTMQPRKNFKYYLAMSKQYKFYGWMFRHNLVPCNRPHLYENIINAKHC